jgi:putative RecB family exonuclease
MNASIIGNTDLGPAALESPGSVFDYVSASRLNLWLKCPLAFRLKYVDGVRFPTPPAVFLGKQVHAALERYYRHRQLGLEITPERICESVQRLWGPAAAEERIPFASLHDETELLAKAMQLVRAYLLKTRHETTRVMAVETAVRTPLIDPRTGEDLDIPLLGIMDLVLGEADGSVILDFKTAARADELSELTHEIQLGCYAYLFRQSTGTTESGLEIRRLIKTKVPQILFHRWPARTERHFQRLLSVVRAYLDDLHSARFVFRPGRGCSYCDFRNRHCREWAGSDGAPVS